jgi:hypothetical protein
MGKVEDDGAAEEEEEEEEEDDEVAVGGWGGCIDPSLRFVRFAKALRLDSRLWWWCEGLRV